MTAGLTLAALFVLSLLAVYAGLQTRAGKDALARYIERSFTAPGLRTVEIGQIDGVLPHRIRIDRLELGDTAGVWLAVEDIRFDWHPSALVRGTFSVASLTAARTILSRQPMPGPRSDQPAGLALPFDISVDLVALRSLVLEEPVLGEAATLRLEANGAFADGVVEAALAAQRTDEAQGAADLWLSFDAASRVLDLEAKVAEPQGGLLARLAGLPGYPALDVAISGEGPTGAWQGTLQASALELLSLDSRIGVTLGEDMKVSLEGSATPGPALSEAPKSALLPDTHFAMNFTWPAYGDRLNVSVARLESRLFRASGFAEVGLDDGRTSGTAELEIADGSLIAPLIEPAAIGSASATISFDGPLSGPSVAVAGRLAGSRVGDARAESLTLDIRLVPDKPFGNPALVLNIDGRIEAAGFSSGVDSLRPLLGPAPTAEFEARLRIADARLDIAGLRVEGPGGGATSRGEFNLSTFAIDAEGGLDLPDLVLLSELAQRPLGGLADADYKLTWAQGSDLDLHLSGIVTDPKVGDPTADALLGSKVTLAGDLTLGPDGSLSLNGLKVAGRAIEASGTLAIPPAGDTLAADYRARITDMAALGLANIAGRAGRLEMSGKASGPIGDPTVNGSASFESVSIADITVERLALDYSARNIVSKPAGSIGFEGRGPLLPDLSGSLRFVKAGELVHVDDIAARARGTTLTGAVVVSLADAPAIGRLQLSARDLDRWTDLAGLRLAGQADALVRLAADNGQQTFRVDGTARNFAIGQDVFAAAAVQLDAEVLGLRDDIRVSAKAAVQEGIVQDATLARATLTFDGTLQDAGLSLQADGEMRGKLKLAAEARMVRGKDETRITIGRLDGEAVGAPLLLRQPATVGLGPAIVIEDLALDIGGGHLAGDFRMTDDRVVLDVHATQLPLGLIGPDLPPQFAAGIADAEIALDGRPSRPDGTILLSVSGLAPGEIRIAAEGLSLHFDGTLRGGILAINGRASGLASVETSVDISVPVNFSFSPVAVGLVDNRPASGGFSYNGPVEPAWVLAGLDRHLLAGKAEAGLRFSGTLEDPVIDGKVQLSEGRYENLDTGTVLTEMELVARPSVSAIVIERAFARDGAEGEVSASGRFDFATADHMAIDLSARFKETRLIRRDELVASVSGDLALTGNTADSLLSGRLEVNEAEIRLVGGLPPSVVNLEVIEKGGEGTAAVTAPSAAPSHTRLDLQVDMPKRVFVRGRGLDSEWGGQLLVSGTTGTPRIEGELRPVRGRYEFAGKTFTLQDGSIAFMGAKEINPVLDLSAARKSGDLIAIIRVTGTARQPRVRMDSEPVLPQDEVLSRILFNKSTGRLSATEALRLSQAVATLSGASDGGGFMDFARGLLNLDVFRFTGGEGEGDGTAQAGKYLSDKVFVGVEAGGSAGSSGATVEVEVTPNLKIEGDVSGDEKSEIGIKWKRDY